MLSGLPAEQTDFRPAPDAWSARDVLGHLILCEMTDWVPRARIILEHGISQPFEPFDRDGFDAQSVTVMGMLEELATVRAENLTEMERLDWHAGIADKRGLHPDLGEVTLGQLVAAWEVHDLAHVAQVAEALAKINREAAGPWRAYLPILDRPDTAD